MSGPAPLVTGYQDTGFAVTTVRPATAGEGAYVAASLDGRVVLAFCGYLHVEEPELRRNPAPHCLRMYEQLGPDFPRELNGSFAIAICDRRHAPTVAGVPAVEGTGPATASPSARLLLITDRLNSRALYYCAQHDFVFGGEVRAILQYPGVSRKLNETRLREFLVMRCLPGFVTYYDHILQAPAASVLSWDGETTQVRRYWEPRFSWDPKADIRELAADAVETVRGAVRRSCTGGARPGLMLSGGLDSRAIAATADRPLLCMTMHGTECYEVRTARQVAEALGHEFRFVELDRTYPLELLPGGALLGDAMHTFVNAQALCMWDALRECGVDRLLNGWAMDVYFSGMCLPLRAMRVGGKRLPLPLLASAERIEPVTYLMNILQVGPERLLDALLRGQSAAEVLAGPRQRLQSLLEDVQRTVPHKHDAGNWLNLLSNSARHPHFLNVQAMDWLVPAAIPVQDNAMIELLLRLPPEHRVNHRIYMHMYDLLSPELRGIHYTTLGGPLSRRVWWNWARKWRRPVSRQMARNVRRMLRLPRPEFVTFWPAAGSAMRKCPEWHDTLRRYCEGSRLADLGVANRDGVAAFIQEHLDGEADHSYLLAPWLTLEAWLETYA